MIGSFSPFCVEHFWDASVFTWLTFLKDNSAADCPSIDFRTLIPLALASVTFTSGSATTLLAIFNRVEISEKVFLFVRKNVTVIKAETSLAYLTSPISIYCSLVLLSVAVTSCIALLISTHAGIESSHLELWNSVIPLPLVSPPVDLPPHQYLFNGQIRRETSPCTIASSDNMMPGNEVIKDWRMGFA